MDHSSDSIDLQSSEGRKVLRLATVGLTLNPEDLTRELNRHQPSPDGRVCLGCGQAWRCPLGRIALGARRLLEMAREGTNPSGPSMVAGAWEELGFFDAPADDCIVPPVLGLHDEP